MRFLRPLPIRSRVAESRSTYDVDNVDIVHVAVSKSKEKGALLIKWTASNFVGREICVVHVHKPSENIPTLLGKMPLNRASEEVVAAHRKEEWKHTNEILKYYESVGQGLKVRMSSVVIQSEQVHKKIVELVNEKRIGKLVMGAAPVTWLNVKSNTKSSYVARKASRVCEIWFINKDKHSWTRDSVVLTHSVPHGVHPLTLNSDNLKLKIPPYSISGGGCLSKSDSSYYNTKLGEETIYNKLMRVNSEVEASRNDASDEIWRLKKLEAETQEANSKTAAYEFSLGLELNLRKKGEDMLMCIKRQQNKVSQKIGQPLRELKEIRASMDILESDVQKVKCEFCKASCELKRIHASIATLRLARLNLRRQKLDAISCFKRLEWSEQAEFVHENICSGYEYTPQLHVYSLSDIEIATCNFSESFKLGHGQFGCVYKGEIMEKTVAMKRLYPQNMHRQPEFQKKVEALGKLEHPNLVKLLGLCPEAWTLVYEYFPYRSLNEHLLERKNVPLFTWKVRLRIISEIARALLFLHSSKPKMIIHGQLKPENILLDSDLSCKICDSGISMIVSLDSLRCPSFRNSTGTKHARPYSDPEYERTGLLTPNSDVYSFGVIILQLLIYEARPVGLVGDILRAISDGNMALLLHEICEEWPSYVARRLVYLGLQFCKLNSKDRPALTPTLVEELEKLQYIEDKTAPCFFQCPISKELMHDPQIAADGFSYDGDFLREWLSHGRDTSPMTNLRFNHLELVSNHSLRQAIQDWVCRL